MPMGRGRESDRVVAGFGENEVECTEKAEIDKIEFLTACNTITI